MPNSNNNIKKTFGKQERLKSRSNIDLLFKQNKNLRIYPFKLVWHIKDSEYFQVKVGVSVSKKLHKKAVTRNLIKRRMREAYRLNKSLLYNQSSNKNIHISFMIVYLSNDIVPYSDFDNKTKQLLILLNNKVKQYTQLDSA